MTRYPIHVPPKRPSSDADCRTAQQIEDFINEFCEAEWSKGHRPRFLTFAEIGIALRLKEETVRSFLYRFCGASDNSIELEGEWSQRDEPAARA